MTNREVPYSTETKKPRIFYGYFILLAAFCITVISAGTGGTFGIFLKPLLTEFGWTRAAASGAQSIHGLEGGLFSIITGWLNDRFGPRLVITVGGFLIGLGFLLMSQISSLWQLYLFYAVHGIGGGSLMIPLMSTITKWFVRRRGLMTGIFMAGTGVGAMIFPPLVSWLILGQGWRNSYIILGIIPLIFIISAAQFLRRDPAQKGLSPYDGARIGEESLSLKGEGLSFHQATHTRQFWMFCIINFCFMFAASVVMVHIIIYAIGLGISALSAASILSFMGGANIGGRLIGGSVGDRIGNRKALTISLMLVCVSLFWLLIAKELWMLYLFAILFGFGSASSGGVQMSPLAARLFGLKAHGMIFGSVFSVGTMGSAIGAVLAGYIFDVTGSYQIAFLASAIFAVLAVILAWQLRPISSEGGENASSRLI